MQMDDEKALKQLKQIFLSDFKDRQNQFEEEIRDLKFKLTDKNSKIENFYPIITDILERKVTESEDEVAKVFSPLMSKALKKEIAKSKEDIIDAIYPIMGQTIKKYVSEAIKDFYTLINQKIDNALRRGIFSRQVKSKISGVSTGDLILQESFPFSVNEIFLIHEESGILIVHESSTHSDINDADLISGMLTAIKTFVAESFKDESGDQNLYEIQYGDSKIILERGRYTYLAIVAKGNEPVNFDDELTNLNDDIHKKYHKDLRNFNGEFKNLLDIKIPINNFLKKYNQPVEVDNIESKRDEAKPILLYLFAFLLLSVLVIYSIIKVPEIITESKINNEIQSRLDSMDKLSTENISWEIDDSAIKIFGFVNSFETRSEIDRLLKNIQNVETFENNLNVLLAPVSADSIIYTIKNTLNKTKFNQAEDLSFEVNNDKVVISGKVETLSDKRELGFLLSKIHGVKYLENNLEYYKLQSMSDEETKNYLKNTQLIFNYRETKISEEHVKKMNQIIPFITQNNISLIVNAFVETEGNEEHNREYALMRAENVISYLESQNVSRNKLTLKTLEARNLKNSNQSRRIEFEINQ